MKNRFSESILIIQRTFIRLHKETFVEWKGSMNIKGSHKEALFLRVYFDIPFWASAHTVIIKSCIKKTRWVFNVSRCCGIMSCANNVF